MRAACDLFRHTLGGGSVHPSAKDAHTNARADENYSCPFSPHPPGFAATFTLPCGGAPSEERSDDIPASPPVVVSFQDSTFRHEV